MSKGVKILNFKGVEYSYEALLLKHTEDSGEEFKEGIVSNTFTGEEIDIKDLITTYIEMNRGLIVHSNHLTHSQRNRLKKLLSNKAGKYREEILDKKLVEGEITKEELEELIQIQDGKDIKKEISENGGISVNLISKFTRLNQDKPLPRDISMPTAGRYLRLIEVLVHSNRIFKKPHGKSKEPTKSELMKYLGCGSANTFKSFMQDLEKYSIARRFKLPSNRNIIFINPLYAHKNLVISKELYQIFRDVLDKELDLKITTYLDMVYGKGDYSGCVTYVNDN